jgi:hypothetical protein
MSQRDQQWSIGSWDGVVMSMSIIAAYYADEPERMVPSNILI